jgi:hypothetical protein
VSTGFPARRACPRQAGPRWHLVVPGGRTASLLRHLRPGGSCSTLRAAKTPRGRPANAYSEGRLLARPGEGGGTGDSPSAPPPAHSGGGFQCAPFSYTLRPRSWGFYARGGSGAAEGFPRNCFVWQKLKTYPRPPGPSRPRASKIDLVVGRLRSSQEDIKKPLRNVS